MSSREGGILIILGMPPASAGQTNFQSTILQGSKKLNASFIIYLSSHGKVFVATSVITYVKRTK